MAAKKKPKAEAPTIEGLIATPLEHYEWTQEEQDKARAELELEKARIERQAKERRKRALANTRRPRVVQSIDLTDEVRLPVEFSAALSAGRGFLMEIFSRQLSLEESVAVAHAFGVLLDTLERQQMDLRDYDERLEAIEGEADLAREKVASLLQHLGMIKKHCFIPMTEGEEE